MRKNAGFKFIALMAYGWCFASGVSWADWQQNKNQQSSHHDDHHQGRHDDHHHDRGFVNLNFNVWPDSYSYEPLAYYPADDAVVDAGPVYQPVVVDGATYYVNNGSYYVYNGYGYESVAPPQAVQQPAVTVIAPPVAGNVQGEDVPDSITVNIPNKKGSYTAVTLKKSGAGFIGPQGEFYPEFPKVSKLKIMYGQ